MNRLDESEVYKWFDILKNNKELVEIRLIGSNKIGSGYFTDAHTLIEAVRPYTDSYNCYFTLNTINPACYSREQKDKIVLRPKNTTQDSEILCRNYVLIDLDPKRPSGVCSTKEESMKAYEKGKEVTKFLMDNGFYEPIVVFSSSGMHLYLKCALINNDENTKLVKRFLNAISMLFSDDDVDCDTSVFNAARISRLIGSYSCKGANNDATRPQRKCRFLSIPDEIKVNAREYFEKIAEMYPEEVKPTRENNYTTEKFDLESFLGKYDINVKKIEQVAGGKKYVLDHCVFNESHRGKDAVIFQRDNGAISYVCLHNSCSHYTWRDVRIKFQPNAYERRYEEPHRTFRPIQKEKKQVILQEKEESKGNVWQCLSEIEDEDRSKIVSIPSGITQYDKECCGFDKPSLSVWSGNNGSAKSTLLNQIALNAVNQGFKVAIYSGELRGKKMKRWLLYQAAGKQYNKKSIYNEYDYYTPIPVKDKIVSWLDGKLYNYNTRYSHNIEQVCLEVEKLVKEHQIDMLIMDNISCLDLDELDGSINEQQKAAIKMLLRMTERMEIATHVVIHPKKSELYLRKNDVSGAKTLTDLADCVFFVHRWNQDTQKAAKEFLNPTLFQELCSSETTNIVEVIKHREFGEAEGHIYKLFYEPESRRLKNSIAEHIVYGWENGDEQNESTQIQQEFENEQNSEMPLNPFDGGEVPF